MYIKYRLNSNELSLLISELLQPIPIASDDNLFDPIMKHASKSKRALVC